MQKSMTCLKSRIQSYVNTSFPGDTTGTSYYTYASTPVLPRLRATFLTDEKGALLSGANTLFAYSRGIISSRKIAQAYDENIIFMALSCDTRPHFTTIADFIATIKKIICHKPRFNDRNTTSMAGSGFIIHMGGANWR